LLAAIEEAIGAAPATQSAQSVPQTAYGQYADDASLCAIPA
jgi:hypothetical protein